MSELKAKLFEIIENRDFKQTLDESHELAEPINKLLDIILKKERAENRLKEDLNKKIYLARQFVHILCHDLKNPLGASKSYFDLIGMVGADRKAHYYKSIEKNLDRSLDMIDEVRTLLAVEEGKLKLQLDFVDLEEMLKESLDILAMRIEEKKIEVVLEIEGNHQVLIEKSSFINSVINNLLTNSIKFSKEGDKIEIKASAKMENVVLTIRDFGMGMPEVILDKLFDHSAATSRPGTGGESGTGFGMPLVKRFVESYEGSILVESWDIEKHPEEHGTLSKIELWKKFGT